MVKDKLYKIVKFFEEEGHSCAVIHKNWMMSEESCYWPTGPGVKSNYLKDGIVDESWPVYPCLVKTSSNNLEKAIDKVKRYQMCSDIDTAESEIEKKTRSNRHKKRVFSDDSLSDGPSTNRPVKSGNRSKISTLPLIEAPVINSSLAQFSHHRALSDTVATARKTLSEDVATMQDMNNNEVYNSDNAVGKCQCSVQLRKDIHMLKLQMEELIVDVKYIKGNMAASSAPSDVGQLGLLLAKLPITNDSDYFLVNDILKKQDILRAKFVKYLSQKGGADVDEVTFMCMNMLFSSNFAVRFNWSGQVAANAKEKKQKLCLKDTEFVTCIHGAVSRRGINCTGKFVDGSIKKWIGRAVDRTHHQRSNKGRPVPTTNGEKE